jgi:hypothetical protein
MIVLRRRLPFKRAADAGAALQDVTADSGAIEKAVMLSEAKHLAVQLVHGAP